MIKLSEGELLDMLPSQLKTDTDMICLSYALKRGIEMLLNYEIGTMTVNYIDKLPEKILDVLAVEMRSLYYTDSMDIETKRQIIKNTYIWHFKAGTVSAVEEMATTIFGSGTVIEWFEFLASEGDIVPGEFDITTDGEIQDPTEFMALIEPIIDRIKNTRSHLRRILFARYPKTELVAATLPQSFPVVTISNVLDTEHTTETPLVAGTEPETYSEITIRNVLDTETDTMTVAAAGVEPETYSEVTISQS